MGGRNPYLGPPVFDPNGKPAPRMINGQVVTPQNEAQLNAWLKAQQDHTAGGGTGIWSEPNAIAPGSTINGQLVTQLNRASLQSWLQKQNTGQAGVAPAQGGGNVGGINIPPPGPGHVNPYGGGNPPGYVGPPSYVPQGQRSGGNFVSAAMERGGVGGGNVGGGNPPGYLGPPLRAPQPTVNPILAARPAARVPIKKTPTMTVRR